MTYDETKRLLEKYAKAIGCALTLRSTPDGWDNIISIVDSNNCPKFTSIGFTYKEVYGQLLDIVLQHHHWTSVDELCIWTDMHDIS